MFWDLAADTWGDEERAAVARVLRSGRYTIGPEVEAFEHAFAGYHGRRFGVMVTFSFFFSHHILFTRVALDRIATLPGKSLETDVFPKLLRDGVNAVVREAPFVDIGTPEDLDAAAGVVAPFIGR